MKSELLKDYLEGDPAAEEELFARYDRDLPISADLWAGIEERIVPVRESSSRWWMGIAAGLVLSIGFLSVFLLSQKTDTIAVIRLPEQRPVIIQQRPPETKTETQIKRIKKPIVLLITRVSFLRTWDLILTKRKQRSTSNRPRTSCARSEITPSPTAKKRSTSPTTKHSRAVC